MVNQAFRIKIAYRSEKEEEEEEEEEEKKIPGIGRYPMGPTKIFPRSLKANFYVFTQHARVKTKGA